MDSDYAWENLKLLVLVNTSGSKDRSQGTGWFFFSSKNKYPAIWFWPHPMYNWLRPLPLPLATG